MTISPRVKTDESGARRARSSISAYRRRLVFERDNYRCQICGDDYSQERIREFARPKGRVVYYCLELDHIQPWKYGGTNAVENLQALCTGCNVRKGAKVQ